ncbi:type I restriction-modification system subunit M [Corynebacterium riegelii]|uniref:type I restriction-modification system subunit M n=1 Tax=Corynebacterium riegelii TaxID=156976 RepID=UPI0023F9389D|nr:type I restriction-modification system subunit M [Corynebacterium riegelii]
MADIEKEVAENAPATDGAEQRAELHKTIWRIANDLRGSVDGWDFKSYVLNMLFYRFVSENLTAYLNAEDPDLDYANLSDEDAEYGRGGVVKDKGFFIPPSQLFENAQAKAHNDPNLNETIEQVFRNIESSAVGTDSEGDFKGLFDDFQVNSTKLGATVAERNKKLAQLLDAVAALPLGSFEDNSIDLFGDAYEFLMQMYASNAGKSGGEFFTPQEVSELLARIAASGKKSVRQVYDPACGSGSLLLKFAKVLGKENVGGFYGQEINITTYNLARMNMFLHDIGFEAFDIQRGDTLINPLHDDIEPFDAIVSNPPYSIRWEGADDPVLINDDRYSPAGVLAPKSKADLAFTMHMLSYLDVDGTAAIVQFPGAMYRGGAEKKIREYLIKNNFVQAVIQLPADLFFGTTIATCILVLKKSKADNSILFVDASKYFKRVGKNNKLFPEHQDAILKLYEDREEVEYETALVSNEDVLDNDSNLSVNSYVAREEVREVIDVKALNEELRQIVARQQVLRESIDEIVADLEGEVDADE